MTFLLAALGVKGLYLTTSVWLLSAVAASWLSDRKGFGERAGLITGLLLSAVGVLIWLAWPAKSDSRWKVQGALPKRGGAATTVAEARAERE
jgi:hypothetical protein